MSSMSRISSCLLHCCCMFVHGKCQHESEQKDLGSEMPRSNVSFRARDLIPVFKVSAVASTHI